MQAVAAHTHHKETRPLTIAAIRRRGTCPLTIAIIPRRLALIRRPPVPTRRQVQAVLIPRPAGLTPLLAAAMAAVVLRMLVGAGAEALLAAAAVVVELLIAVVAVLTAIAKISTFRKSPPLSNTAGFLLF